MHILHGDCRALMAGMDAESVDAIVTDPPYELGFMGKAWDASGVAFQVATWQAAWRVLKPGGHLLAFGGTRTYHRMTCAIEDAGFEIRDCLQWIYGSGFPKSLDVSKAIDKAAGEQRDRIRGVRSGVVGGTFAQDAWSKEYKDSVLSSDAITPAAQQWQGWGTALKPAYEPIVLARKPLIGTVAANVQAYGTGAINVDGCRVDGAWRDPNPRKNGHADGWRLHNRDEDCAPSTLGRWPANVLHDGSDEVLALFPLSNAGTETKPRGTGGIWSDVSNLPCGPQYGDTGSAARFFYCAKASRKERGDGNGHPTVKPLALMRYLVRLITPPNGLVLDPFAGSGTTGIAAIYEGFRFVGIEQSAEYAALAERRIEAASTLPIEATA
jgi:DNA modification methylase